MTSKNWLKDVLLCGVVLAGIASVAAYLLASDRIKTPATFEATDDSLTSSARSLDAAITSSLEAEQLAVVGKAKPHQVFRRLSLALAGTLPSVEELRALEKVPDEKRVDWFVSHLLEDQRTADYLAERFARVFVGVEEGPFLVFRRNRFVSWLSEQLLNNTRYDQLVRTMINSEGIWTDRPEVNFYTYNIIPDEEDNKKPDPIRLAARTSRAFLGMRIDCLQCHDDFLGTMNLGSADAPVEGSQLHFHALASFFSQVENSLVGVYDNMDSNVYKYQLLDADETEAIEPEVPFHPELVDTTETNLRHRLSRWVTHRDNLPFARATVNRVWAIMFGQGLIQPVDDIPLDGPFPTVLNVLAHDFIANDYDLHRLIRVIAVSSVFQRDSVADFEILPTHVSHYAVFPMNRLRPEQVAGSIIQSTSLKTIDSTSHIIARLVKYGQENEFVNRFGDLGEDEFNDKSETITQRLLMMNGEMVNERLTDALNSVTRVALLSPSVDKAVEIVFLATLCREPTPEERNYFTSQIKETRVDQRNEKISDLYWTLINSVEFVWNH